MCSNKCFNAWLKSCITVNDRIDAHSLLKASYLIDALVKLRFLDRLLRLLNVPLNKEFIKYY